MGRGVISDDFVYLPVADEGDNNQVGGLGVYDVRTWKVVERPAWEGSQRRGGTSSSRGATWWSRRTASR